MEHGDIRSTQLLHMPCPFRNREASTLRYGEAESLYIPLFHEEPRLQIAVVLSPRNPHRHRDCPTKHIFPIVRPYRGLRLLRAFLRNNFCCRTVTHRPFSLLNDWYNHPTFPVAAVELRFLARPLLNEATPLDTQSVFMDLSSEFESRRRFLSAQSRVKMKWHIPCTFGEIGASHVRPCSTPGLV